MEWLDSLIYESGSKDHDQLTNELGKIVGNGTDGKVNENQYEHAIKPKHFIIGNDGLRQKDSKTQLHATVNGEANPEINIIKISANTPPHNVNGSDGLGRNGCEIQQQAPTKENGHENLQTIKNTVNENNNEQANDMIARGNENKLETNNENQHKQETKLQDKGNTKLKGTSSLYTTYSKQELGNSKILQSESQPSSIATPPKLTQVKWKVVVLKQRKQPTTDRDTRSKISFQKSISDKSLRIHEARANFDVPNHYTPQERRRERLHGYIRRFEKNPVMPIRNEQIKWSNVPAQLIKIPPHVTMTTDVAHSRWRSAVERELEMIVMAHGT
ncbi:MAG: hypothetical protein EZS28_008848 [Streblomastix strix]|uniref:Uncharacterized protein n=1 Tax=Streblomastix strix TaxID=222440 RepID=A0A5J4WKV2_9EUKA|nr:MAG: hypothetical protein EZS28_008848 [Streblomastix strix]